MTAEAFFRRGKISLFPQVHLKVSWNFQMMIKLSLSIRKYKKKTVCVFNAAYKFASVM